MRLANEADDSYLDEWEKQFGVQVKPDSKEPDENKGQAPDNSPDQDDDEEEQDTPETGEQKSSSVDDKSQDREPDPESEPPKPKSKDDEYREFIDSQPTDELKERARKIVQGLKSADGRTSALQRQVNAREQLIKQLQQRRTQHTQEPAAPTSSRQEKDSAQTLDQELPEKVKALKKKNPEAADVIDQIAKYHSDKSLKQMQDLLDSRLGTIEQDREVQAKQQEWNRLEERAKPLFQRYGVTAADVVRSDDFQAWLELKQAEEPGVYKLYKNADDADTAYLILEKYEHEYQEAAKAAGIDVSEEDNSTQNRGDEIREKRERNKAGGKGLKPTRAAAPTSDTSNLSYEEEFKRQWGNKGKKT